MISWKPYVFAIVIGLLIGIEREKAHPQQKTMGVRTFLLISLLGALSGGMQNQGLSILLMAFSFSLIVISYFIQMKDKNTVNDLGLTTEFAAGIVFCLGYYSHQSLVLVTLLSPIVALVLFSKSTIHKFTNAIKPSEFQSALLLLLIGVLVINVVKDEAIDPWGVFNPQKFGFIILILAALQFTSYFLVKIIGEKKGSIIIGFLGGFVSSTTVLLSCAHLAQHDSQKWQMSLSTTLVATIAALVEVLIIVGFISSELCWHLFIPISLSCLYLLIVVIVLVKKSDFSVSKINVASPLDWGSILRLAFLLSGILGFIALVKIVLGDKVTWIVSFITGMFELHGVTLANASMYSSKQLTLNSSSLSIYFAVCSSLLAKILTAATITRNTFTRNLALSLMPLILMMAIFIVMQY